MKRIRGGQIVHGHAKNDHSPTYRSWAAMMKRCYNDNWEGYAYYGGRGIKVCRRWHDFPNFLFDMGERPPDMTLDRWPNANGMYAPGNVRWATKTEQARNRRSFKITHDLAQEILGRFEYGESRQSITDRLKLSKASVTTICNGTTRPELERPWLVHNVQGLAMGRGSRTRRGDADSTAAPES